jgi:hypothetical protein
MTQGQQVDSNQQPYKQVTVLIEIAKLRLQSRRVIGKGNFQKQTDSYRDIGGRLKV